jgi:hypothetical protein
MQRITLSPCRRLLLSNPGTNCRSLSHHRCCSSTIIIRRSRHSSSATTCRISDERRSDSTPQFAEWKQSIPQNYPWQHPTSLAMSLLTGLTVIGAVVGGILARKRRQQLEEMNLKLRKINQELRRKNEESNQPDDLSIVTALQRSLDAPSAAHPVESYGSLKVSLARARRQVEECIREATSLIKDTSKSRKEAATAALPLLAEALQLSKDIKDIRAERAVSRLRSRALRSLGDLPGSLEELQQVLDLTAAVGESREMDADTLGEMGDVLAEMGNFEAAGRYYDMTIDAIEGTVN